MSNFSFLKTEDGVLEIFTHNPDRFTPLGESMENILKGPSELSVMERELIFAFVSACNACTFCVGAHETTAKAFGLEPGVLDQLLNSEWPESINKKLQPCLELSKKVTKDSSRIVRQDVLAVIDAGWKEETAHDVISITAMATCLNFLLNSHGVSGSPKYFKLYAEMFGSDGSTYSAKSHPMVNRLMKYAVLWHRVSKVGSKIKRLLTP